MKKLTAIDLRENMAYGQKIYTSTGGNFRGYRFVGHIPSSANYLILSDGMNLRYLHVSGKDDSFSGDWYSGKYDTQFAGNVLLQERIRRLEGIFKIYLDLDDETIEDISANLRERIALEVRQRNKEVNRFS